MGVYADLFRYRELFASLFRRDLRAKYKGSVLGLAWSLALPVFLMLVYLLVFSVLWRSEPSQIDQFWLFLLCGLPAWAYFAAALQTSARSLIENANLIRKVRFPRQLVPLSIVATQVVSFAAMLAVVIVLSLVFRPEARATVLLALPLAVLVVVAVAGVSLAVASLNAVFRDVEFVVSAALLPWFFLTPVLYQLERLPGGDAHPWLIDVLHWANPMTPPILALRAPLFSGELPALGDTLYLVGFAIVGLALGALVFSRVDDRIASEA